MRRRLFAAVSMTALLGAPAFAQEATVDDERTEPVDTATASNGSPANLIIGANGRVRLTNVAGPAVRVNSNNTFTTTAGSFIEILDQNANGENIVLANATGVQIDAGTTTEVEHSGAIRMVDGFAPGPSPTGDPDGDMVDTDGDGIDDAEDTESDGAFADDLNKIGMLIGELDGNFLPAVGQADVTGNITITSTGTIEVEGQNSYGLRAVAGLNGDFITDGQIAVLGEDSTALSLEANISGDVQISRVRAISPRGQGVFVGGDVGGGLRFTNLVRVTGYRTDTRLLEAIMTQLDDGDDNLDSGSAVLVAGNIVDGIFLSAGAELRLGSGSGAALDIGSGGEIISIGSTTLPDDFAQTEETADADDLPDQLQHAIVNRGQINASGVFDGKAATAFLVAGRDENGLLRAVILGGDGISNEGQISAVTHDGEATAAHIGEGAQAASFRNTGVINANASFGFESDGFADDVYGQALSYGLVLAEGSAIQQILNEAGTILASVQTGSNGTATAIKVDSNATTSIINEGIIAARPLGTAPDGATGTPTTIAIDATNQTTGLTITQQQGQDDNGDPTTDTILMAGDILFGSGDDRLELLTGTVTGDVYFGAGADTLVIDGAELEGVINDSDANLTIDVTNGRITLTGDDSISLADADFNDGAVLNIRVDTGDRSNAFIDASGSVTFAEGSDLSVSLGGLIENVQNFTLVTANTLMIADTAILATTEAPFLYNAEISTAENDPNTLVLSLSRKSADQLGMNSNEAAAYDEAFAAMTSIDSLGNAFAAVRSADEFFGAYNQLLPEYASSAIQFALASNDAAAGALSSRLRNARMSPDELAGVWIQEFGYFADRNSTSFGPGYRGQGIGVAMGIDRPVGPFYAVGFHLVGSASEVEEIDGFDEPMVALSGQFGSYAALDLGGVDVSASVGVGYDYFETERNIIIDAFSTVNTAEWSGWHLTASAQAGRDFEMGNWVVRPEASMTWLSLFESGYSEQNEDPTFAQLALIVDDRESSVLTAGATVTLARRFGTDLSWWSPSMRIGYRGELLGEEMDTIARFGETGNPFTLQSEALPGSGVLAGFGLSAGSQYTTFTFAYDADVRDKFVRHVARLVVRLTF